MGVVRPAHGGALLALAALLLLLLARLPAPPPRPARPRPLPLALPHPPPSSSAAPAPAPAPTSTRPPPPPPARNASGPVLVRDVYVGGFSEAHAALCPALGATTRLLILVTSAPSHAAARAAVRLTWGHYAARSDVVIAFVLGAAPAALQPALQEEDALYGDLIRGRFQDSYSNLTLKTLALLEWAAAYCPRAPHLLKTDDDMFVNVPRLLRFAEARAGARRTIWGRVVRKSLPKRTTRSKYYVPAAQYPGAVFPDFTTGPAYLLTADCVAPLLAAAPSARYLRLEDVFVTGVLAQRLNISRRHAPEFYNRKVAGHPCTLARGVAVHMVRYHEQFDFWRKLLDNRTHCAPPQPARPHRRRRRAAAALLFQYTNATAARHIASD